MTTLNWALVNSGLGTFAVGGTDDSLVEVRFPDQLPERLDHSPLSALVSQAARELEEFLSGARQSFDLPLRLEGTIFQNAVWGAIEHIPYGTVATYGEVAKMINKPSSARAVAGHVERTRSRCFGRVTEWLPLRGSEVLGVGPNSKPLFWRSKPANSSLLQT